MNDLVKTLIFAGAAALVALLAFVLRPAPFEQPRQQAGERLFADLEDASSADALQIVSFDRDSSKTMELKIQRKGDGWVIASHNDYPADATGAKDRIQDVALKLMDLEILDVASELASDHALFGVVSPEGDALEEADDEDIGQLVGLQDEDGNILAQLIIGKEVRDEQSEEAKRFVRKAGEATVYTAAIETDQLKSDFADWIESDLLQISGSDIRRVTIKDYNARIAEARGPTGALQQIVMYDPRFEMSVDWDAADSKWQFASMVERRGNRLAPSKLTDDEQLNAQKLDGLKDAVDNLKIVDVTAKPKELIEGVKSDEDLVNDPRIRPLLEEKGFYPMRGELLSSEGEVRVQTEEGIEYILRFGREAGVELDEDNKSKLTRYMLVSAAVAEEQLVAKEEDSSTSPPSNPLSPLGAGGQSGDEGSEGEASADSAPAAPDESTDESSSDDTTTDPANSDTSNSDKPEVDDPSPESEDPSEAGGESPTSDPSDPEATPPDSTVPPGSEPADTTKADDELATKRKEAEAKVAELNQKFANWYYVISEDEYKQIRLGRFDVISEKSGASFGLDELRGLDEPPPDAGDDEPELELP